MNVRATGRAPAKAGLSHVGAQICSPVTSSPGDWSFRFVVVSRNPYVEANKPERLRDSSLAALRLARNDILQYVILRSEATKDLVFGFELAQLMENEFLR